MLGFFTAPRIAFGRGALEQLSALGADRPVVVVAPALAEHPRVRRIAEELAKREVAVSVLAAPPGPPGPGSAEALAAALRDRGPDWIVAVGGGRTIDLAKAAWLRYARPDLPLESVSPLVELGLRQRARFAAIPSTSGPGTESGMSPLLYLPDGATLRPASRELVPDWALLDPSLPATVPRPAAADAAAVALGHALETVTSAWSNPIAEALAREAFARLLSGLPKLARDPGDPDLLGIVHHAASMAGLAAANAQDGPAAAIAETLAPALGLPYGRCLGAALPVVAEFQFPSSREAYATLAPALGLGSVDHRSDLSRKLRTVGEAIGIPPSLRSAGTDESRFRAAIPGALARLRRHPGALASPRIPSESEWTRLLERTFDGGAVDF